ncbi:MAG: DUF4157 domain-containing protein, partial [Lysobacter sp.]|nr:DUF4157 domain-containing protein [Lysobacter sp.]
MRAHTRERPAGSSVRSQTSESAHTAQHERGETAIPQAQRTMGNRALQRSLLADAASTRTDAAPSSTPAAAEAIDAVDAAVQPSAAESIPSRLAMHAPGDVYEREADRVADQAMRAPATDANARGERSAAIAPALDTLQRAPASAQSGERSAGSTAIDAGVVGEALADSGRALDPTTRAFMETRLGQDFSQVQVHTGQRAAESAQAVNATAYTVGHHVVFGEGAYRPETERGRRLIAHELTHVQQQRAAGPRLQRDEKDAQAVSAGASLDEIFDRLATDTKKPVGPKARSKLRAWAATYEKKRGQKPGYDQISNALNRLRIHGSLPEVMSDAEIEARKVKPPVPCDQIIPYKVGAKVLITHLLDKILPPDRVGTLKGIADKKQEEIDEAARKSPGTAQPANSVEDIISKHPSAVYDLIMSASVPKSATAEITESGPEGVAAKVDLPGIPAKGGLPAYEAFTAVMNLGFDTSGGGYTLKFTRMEGDRSGASFSLYGLGFKKSGDTIEVGVKGMDYFKIKLAKGDNGELTLQAFDVHPIAKMLLGLSDEISLFNVTQTGQVGQTAVGAQKTESDVRSKFAPPPAADRTKAYAG